MRKRTWIGLVVVALCAGFAAGVVTGKGRKPQQAAREVGRAEREKPKARDDSALLASLKRFRAALAERGMQVENLKAELAEVRAKLPAPLPPAEQGARNRQEEIQKKIDRMEALYEKCKPLRAKILQRNDKALREQGLTELATLIQSGEAEQMLIGLSTLSSLWALNLDKERFRPGVLEALKHEDAEVRRAAFWRMGPFCSQEEQFRIALSLKDDPSPEIRVEAVCRLPWLAGSERSEEVASALKAILQDEDRSVRNRAASEVSGQFYWDERYGPELEDIMIDLSKDKETAGAARQWILRRRPVSARIARRLVEMHDEDSRSLSGWEIRRDGILDEAKPIVRGFCLRVIRETIEPGERWGALDRLGEMGDPSVIPQLEEISRGPDADGIEEHLASTIELLRQKESEQR